MGSSPGTEASTRAGNRKYADEIFDLVRQALHTVQPLDMVYKRYNNYTMYSFEYDEGKSKKNSEKHGIDFIDAQKLWEDPDLLEIPAKTTDEKRFLVVGRIEQTYWSGVITYRNENIRIISIRRSRNEEIELYESF